MPARGSIQGDEAVRAHGLQRSPHRVGELSPKPVEMAPVAAFRQNAMQDRRPCRAVAHGRRKLEVDDLRDPIRTRCDVAAAQGGADRLGGAAHLHNTAKAVERGKPGRRLRFEIRERVVFEDHDVVLLGQSEHPVNDSGRGNRARRIVQAAGGEIETRPMLSEQALKLGDIGAFGGASEP